MRKALKFLHTLASSGLVGAVLAYAIIVLFAPQDTPRSYAESRQTIAVLCNYVLLPSMAIAVVSGLLAMAAHRAFLDTRWAWMKAILGLSTFEATLVIVHAKATAAAAVSAKVAAGELDQSELALVLANEWGSLAAIFALSMAQIALGVWRPRFATR